MASTIEREMRNNLIDKLRALRPESRIIHELNTAGQGSCRADIAAIGKEEILLFEIKSEKDVLKRLAKQKAAFEACSHKAFFVLDKKFFTPKQLTYVDKFSLDPNTELTEALGTSWLKDNVWHYPEPRPSDYHRDHSWKIKHEQSCPSAKGILRMLWADELREVCKNLNLPYRSKDNMAHLIERITLDATGRDVVKQVCLMLRKRIFAEADDAVYNY